MEGVEVAFYTLSNAKGRTTGQNENFRA